jgi:uncharacterized protein YneF (UPF0154 family)
MIPIDVVMLAGQLLAVVLVGGVIAGFFMAVSILAADFMETAF